MTPISDTLWHSVKNKAGAKLPVESDSPAALVPPDRPAWSPYVAGVALGLTLLAALAILGPGVETAAESGRVIGGIERLAASGTRALQGRAVPAVLLAMLGVFLGSLLSAAGAGRGGIRIELGRHCRRRTRLLWALAGGVLAGAACRLAGGVTLAHALAAGGVSIWFGVLLACVSGVAAFLAGRLVRRQWL